MSDTNACTPGQRPFALLAVLLFTAATLAVLPAAQAEPSDPSFTCVDVGLLATPCSCIGTSFCPVSACYEPAVGVIIGSAWYCVAVVTGNCPRSDDVGIVLNGTPMCAPLNDTGPCTGANQVGYNVAGIHFCFTPGPTGLCGEGTGVIVDGLPVCVETCPTGSVGVQPDCTPNPNPCPDGTVGVQPTCISEPTPCPDGTAGIDNHCIPLGTPDTGAGTTGCTTHGGPNNFHVTASCSWDLCNKGTIGVSVLAGDTNADNWFGVWVEGNVACGDDDTTCYGDYACNWFTAYHGDQTTSGHCTGDAWAAQPVVLAACWNWPDAPEILPTGTSWDVQEANFDPAGVHAGDRLCISPLSGPKANCLLVAANSVNMILKRDGTLQVIECISGNCEGNLVT
jgi:hypothetical protein